MSVDVTTAIEILLEPNLDASEVSVGGLQLGDPVSRIDPSRALAGHCPNVPCLSRSHSSTGSIEIQREGEPALRPYPLSEIVEDVFRHGGWLELSVPTQAAQGTLRLDIDEGRVVGMHLLAGPWLEPLGLRARESIAELFGHNDRYGRSYQKTTWAWPERGFAIVWHDGHERLESISLGPRSCAAVPMFGAAELVRLALQWKRLHPDDDWPLRPRESSVPESILAARLGALMRAFDVAGAAPSLARFFEGAFVVREEQERAKALLTYLGASEYHFVFARLEIRSSFQLRHIWWRMLELRRHIEEIDAFNDDVMVAGGIYFYPVEVARRAAAALESERDHIDGALAVIVDPSRRSFTWGQLVREHGFPDDDLEHAICDEPY